jgi:AraC-like DNA-binding protein
VPVELAPGATVVAERVRHGAEAAATDPFPHYHDVCELVVFGQVSGHFIADDRLHPLSPGCVVFIPSMHQHDFALAPGARDWVLIQIDPAAGEELAQRPGLERLASPFCARPDPRLGERIATLAGWLADLGTTDPLVPGLVDLVAAAAVRSPVIESEAMPARNAGFERLRPAIERLRADPAHPPSINEAASLCGLSVAYFSRRFGRQLGMSWGDYARTYRLHMAARRLLSGDSGIAEIAYGLGFATPSHFAASFHARFGVSPRAYRQAHRRRQEPGAVDR